MTKQAKADFSDVYAKFVSAVKDRFDFSNAVYNGGATPVTGIQCPEHGEFKQYPSQLRREDGSWCPKCGDIVRRAKQRTPLGTFTAKAAKLHNGRYDYSKTVYTLSSENIVVICPEHGDFVTTPNNHTNKARPRGCPMCGAARRGHRSSPAEAARKTAASKIEKFTPLFLERAKKVHGDLYDYSHADYKGMAEKITIICKDHGPFEQVPQHHIKRAQGCPGCSHHRSKGEAGLLSFVSIFAEPQSRVRGVVPPKELDIYIPEANLAVEYCGEYWHGADSVEDERRSKNRHYDKHKACEVKGIRLLTVYESEWHQRPGALKRLIRNAVGKGRGRLMARKCLVAPVPLQEAAAFYENYHPQGGSGYGINFGLYHGLKLVACMRFTYGANDRGKSSERVWTLTRYATRVSVAGGASRLFATFVQEHDPAVVKSFSDNRYFTGAMYERLGFEMEEETKPDYQVWHQKLGLMAKAMWQRKAIPARIRELGSNETFDPVKDPRTERDMTFLLGAHRLFDCGKKRWVWTPG